jgi:hypothetical protein
MQKLEKHIDGEWWTENHFYQNHRLEVKMREGHGAKVHIWNVKNTNVIKTFRFGFITPEKMLNKAHNYVNKLYN